MSHKKAIALAVLAAASAVLLSSCGAAATPLPSAGVAAAAFDGNLSLLSGSAKSNNAPKGTGDWAVPRGGAAPTGAQAEVAERWVELDISAAGDLDPVVVNGAGLTLYRFDKDTTKPSASNCFDACATTWPPVLVAKGGKVHLDPKLDKKLVGFIPRGENAFQLTLKGWPLYRFAQDTAPGDTKGQGVGGTWFGIAPDGTKAGVGDGGDDDNKKNDNNKNNNKGGKNNSTPDANTATSAVLFDDARFSDDGPSQGVSNSAADDTGCVNLDRPDVTSSISASGSYTIWTDADCKGKSKKLDGNVAELSKVGFDDKISSIKLAVARD